MDTIEIIGAGYGALQAVAQFVMMLAGRNTWAWKIAKYITSGPARPVSVGLKVP